MYLHLLEPVKLRDIDGPKPLAHLQGVQQLLIYLGELQRGPAANPGEKAAPSFRDEAEVGEDRKAVKAPKASFFALFSTRLATYVV